MIKGSHLSEKSRKLLSDSIKTSWQKPGVRENYLIGMRTKRDKVKYAQMMSEKSKQWWQDPDYRARKSEWGKQLLTNLWKQPEFRAAQTEKAQTDNPSKRPEVIKKISDRRKENWRNPEYRRIKSEQAKRQIKIQRETTDFQERASHATSKRMKAQWQEPEYRDMMINQASRLWATSEYRDLVVRNTALANHIKPNCIEQILTQLLDDNNLPFIYVGDGSVVIEGKIPDFINSNSAKQIIELFGDYWHSEKKTGKSVEQEENDRIEVFAKYGFSTLIIWEHELQDEEAVINKIKGFMMRR